jgi:hypothetical protein
MQNHQNKPVILKTCFPSIEQSKLCTGRIYERANASAGVDNNSTFDIEVTIGPTRGRTMDDRKLVHEIVVQSARDVSMNKLTRYLHWKFRSCQRSDDCGVIPVRSGGTITHVRNNLEWIKSILEVEFDYHVGSANCSRAENKVRLHKYRKSQCAGYDKID